ncbi:HIRAN domain-containing protein [Niabella hirudinis]|uniref:HIRAN domain-containing protein n=1 Tax=Niabella hirudinis TaxID=1285929 RepID=UPI003EC0C717
MRRTDFIRGVVGFLGLSVLPRGIVKQYHRIYLLQSFVRGFRFYEGMRLLDQMQEGDMLQMVREPENQFDTSAIALHFNKHRIGYIPREDNELLSKLMDAEVLQMQAEITHLKKEAKAWENVHVAVYVLKEITGALPESALYLTQLETPRYRTLKLTEDRVVNIYYEEEEDDDVVMDASEFYEAMVENSKDDHIYTILHDDFESGRNLQEIITEGRMLINENRLPADLKQDALTRVLKDNAIVLNNVFDERGYMVANVNRVAELSYRIEKVIGVFDKAGRLFYEIRFV